jgi:CubicO group peptidase (beta-lactamase class C family)
MMLDDHIERARAAWSNVGLAVAVVHSTEVLYAQGFGVKALASPARITPATLFQVGSTTKAFTAAVLGVLVDEGRIDWDDPISSHLPEFQLHDPWLTQHLTIRDAVAHRSGIPHSYPPFLSVMDSDSVVSQLRYIEPVAAYRDSFVYSNLMYAALGKVIETVTHETWNDFVGRRLLSPLEMNRSGTSPYEFWNAQFVAPTFLGSAPAREIDIAHARDANVALPHGCDEHGSVVSLPWQSYDNAAAAGSIVSSAADMANWLILHLNEGCFKGRQLLTKATLRELHAPQNPHAGTMQFPFEASLTGYAMGWWRTRYRGHTHLVHSGTIIGSPAYVALLPDPKMGVVVLSNGSRLLPNGVALHKAIALTVFDSLLGVPPRDWVQELSDQADNAQRQVQEQEAELSHARLSSALPSLSLERYTGFFEDQRGHSGPLDVRLQEGRLVMSFAGEGAFSAHLEHWHRDVFRLRPKAGVAEILGPSFVTFTLNPRGRVISLSAFESLFQRVPQQPTP